MSQSEATKLTPIEWMSLWQEIERSNRRTVFSDWIEFSESIDMVPERHRLQVSSDRLPLLKRIDVSFQGLVHGLLDEEGKILFEGAYPVSSIEKNREISRVERGELREPGSDDVCGIRLEFDVTRLHEKTWEIQMSWQIESILLQMSLSVPELYEVGRSLAIRWVRQLEQSFHNHWRLGASSYWLEAFRHNDALMGDTVVRQRALVNVMIK